MSMEEEGGVVILTTKTNGEWLQQAKDAMKVMVDAGYKNLNEFAEKDKENCSKLLQACDALGQSVEPVLFEKCGLKRVMSKEEFLYG